MTRDRVVVVGAGVAGVAVARALARSFDVTVLERAEVGGGATGVSAGLIAPTLFYGDLPAVARFANRAVRAVDGAGAFSFTERPRIDVVSRAEVADARRRARELADEGFPVAYLEREAVERRFGRLDLSRFAGAVCYEDTGWVDPYTYAVTLAELAEDGGVRVETGVRVSGLVVDGGSVAGVETDDGRHEADAIVLAAGWRTPELMPGDTALPVRPYRTQCLVLEPDPPLDEDVPLGRVSGEGLYFRPEHSGRILVGGGAHECRNPEAASRRPDEAFTDSVATIVPRLFDGVDGAGLVTGWAGFDAATPDARPLIGRIPGGPENLLVATGFNGLGVMIGPIAGPIVREHLGGSSAPFPTDPFAPDRFGDVATTFDLRSTSDV
ncbi:FAD-binding oxidoreductase [Halovivax sp.]|uniref:NAD(P)/FAD-dependent oxidoreductase n=1 Tax=Halovivax sp. TaxID=1935978 RepID=UPI0025C30A98|nr:FAD-binding oxidoreductase [Halovivax sp.]